jgi:DNA repair exonuclease SbcCD ATPase subunit
LGRAGEHLDGLKVTLSWANGDVSEVALLRETAEGNEVRYLSQRFVERLCAEDQIGKELVDEIESVIFSYIDPTDTLNASSFAELRALRTESIRDEADRLRADIVRLIREECSLRDAARKLPEKQERIRVLRKERDELVKQIPKPVSDEEARVQKELQDSHDQIGSLQKRIGSEKQKLQKIKDIRARIGGFKAQMSRFSSEIEPLLDEAGIPTSERAAFHPTFPSDTELPLSRRAAAIQNVIQALEGTIENPAEGTARWFEGKIKMLSTQATADKARQDRTKAIQTRVAAIHVELKRIEDEITKIEGPDRARLAQAGNERLQAYGLFFENLKAEQATLEELYAPVKARLQSRSSSQQEQDLEFSIKWEADVTQWLDRGSVLFDQRRAIPYGTMQGLSAAAKRILGPAWSSGETAKIESAHDTFLAEFRKKELLPSSYLRSGVTLEDVLLWLYEVDHVRLSYSLKYNGVELDKLSPGTKGIVLLILYLGIDVDDTRPLIVDQPDENLDNESIFALLAAYFRTAKGRRQILLITHNPNLVVNGDSEQIIVATAERRPNGLPHITYVSGALENTASDGTGIREHVCRILEGGSDAFRRRERRYSLS